MSFCKVCGKEYHGNEENFICIHCKAEKGMLKGQELEDYKLSKRELDANERNVNFKLDSNVKKERFNYEKKNYCCHFMPYFGTWSFKRLRREQYYPRKLGRQDRYDRAVQPVFC